MQTKQRILKAQHTLPMRPFTARGRNLKLRNHAFQCSKKAGGCDTRRPGTLSARHPGYALGALAFIHCVETDFGRVMAVPMARFSVSWASMPIARETANSTV